MYRERRDFNRGGRNQGYGRPQQQRRHNPLPEGFSLFYISIVCPEAIEAKIKGFKEYMDKTYGCRAALKSPAHLTIVPPFRAEDETAPLLGRADGPPRECSRDVDDVVLRISTVHAQRV